MKYVFYLLIITILLFSCMGPRSRKSENRRQYPPAKMFEGKELAVAQAIYDGNISEMEQLIKTHPIDVNHISRNGYYTFLMYACILEDQEAMDKLMQMGADPNLACPTGRYDLPVNYAVALINYDMLKLLLKYKASLNHPLGWSPLVHAMMLGGYENTERQMLDFLLQHGADINYESFQGHNIMKESYEDHTETANYFLDKGGNPTIKGINYSPMAESMQFDLDNEVLKQRNPNFYNRLLQLKSRLEKEYHIQFPYIKPPKIEMLKYSIQQYEDLSPRDKMVVNFRDNYGENKYKQDLEELKNLSDK